ncbi:MAG: DUF2817 domain-containing protein [Candidatus Caenarcaniphilales bacterium]|nr:DUF2817 domain-containing protein [Candidatus Caenarcaniphilales bacterium]
MKLLLLAGTHGVEKQSSYFLDCFFDDYKEHFTAFTNTPLLEKLSISKLFGLEASDYEHNCKSIEKNQILESNQEATDEIIAIPVLNPTGLKNLSRTNSNKVDLNRNMPSKNWEYGKLKVDGEANPYYPGEFPKSELETQILTQIIEDHTIDLVVSFHTNHFVKNKNDAQINYDGKGKHKTWAENLAKLSNLPFTEDIGYPTPGSLGSYAKEQNFDCITVEFEDSDSEEQIYESYKNSFFESIKKLFEKDA